MPRYLTRSLPRPPWKATRRSKLILKLRDVVPRLFRFGLRSFQIFLRRRDYRAENIFLVVDIALSQKLSIELVKFRFLKLNLVVGLSYGITCLLKCISP